MKPLDYGRSFLIGNGPGNEVRFWVESRTRIIDNRTGVVEDYVQTGSCKSEHTFAEKGLFHEDNYDFLPIFGPQYGLIFRRNACVSPRYRSCVSSADMWSGQKYHLVEGAIVEELEGPQAIREATYRFAPIVAQTEISDDGTGLTAIIECPVKTMNTNRENDVYQVDTGPVAFPDLTERRDRYVDGISLAFVAFNAPDFADFVLEVPTTIDEGDDTSEEVYHFSKLLRLEAVNRVYSVE